MDEPRTAPTEELVLQTLLRIELLLLELTKWVEVMHWDEKGRLLVSVAKED